MTLVVDGDHPGTPEAAWLGAGTLQALERWSPPAVPRVLVVAPHPDDEVLGPGGTLRLLADLGAKVDLLAVTDGEAAFRATTTRACAALGRRRILESSVALSRLGVDAELRVRLGLPDGRVSSGEAEVADAVAELTDDATLVLAPWAADGHPDHDATGRAARRGAARSGARLLEYLVWAWHWADPSDGALPLAGAVRVDLDRRTRAAKRWATSAYTSQIRPPGVPLGASAVLPPPVLRRAWRPFEVLLPWPGHG